MKSRLFFGNTFCAVEYSFDEQGNEVFYCLQLIKNKKELEIKETKSLTSIESLLKYLKEINQTHLVLVINNKQVLSKSVELDIDHKDYAYKKAFPSLSLEDFYTQVTPGTINSTVSVVRKTYVEELIREFSNNNITVLDVFLKNTSLEPLLEMLTNDYIFTSNAKLTLSQGKIDLVENKVFQTDSYEVNGLVIKSQYLLALSAIVNFYLLEKIHYNKEVVNNYKEKQKFTHGYKLALGVIFLLVLTNFIFFSNYNNKIANLSGELEVKKNDKIKFKKITKELVKKRKLLKELQNSSLQSVSMYSDQIAANVPNSITLKEITYQPLIKTLKKGKEATFELKKIEVKGGLRDYSDFNAWIDELEKKEWVSELLELTTEKEKRKKNYNFTILILVK